MTLGKPLFMTALSVVAFNSAQAEEVFIHLRPASTVEGRSIRLGDIADVTANSAATASQWGAIEITKLASLSEPVSLSRGEIALRLSAHSGFAPAAIAWGGSQAVAIRAVKHRIDLLPYINSTAAALISSMSDNDSQVSLTLIDEGGIVEVPDGRLTVRPDLSSIRRFASNLEVLLVVAVDDEIVAAPLLRFSVNRRPSAIRPGNEPAPLSAKREAMGVDSAGESGASFPADVSVLKNRSVPILIKAGSVHIESAGIALANARPGEQVSVRRVSNGSVMTGHATMGGGVVIEEK